MATAPPPEGFVKDEQGYYIEKDPEARKDYAIEWKFWLIDADVITEILWIVEDGLTIHNQGYTDTRAFIEVSGGEVGRAYVCTCHIITANALEDDESFRVAIIDKSEA